MLIKYGKLKRHNKRKNNIQIHKNNRSNMKEIQQLINTRNQTRQESDMNSHVTAFMKSIGVVSGELMRL